MRRSDKEVTDLETIMEIMNQCRVIRIAFQDEQGLYIVPLNFGFVNEHNTFKFYIHSAIKGRKVEALKSGRQAAFEMDCDHMLVEGADACSYTYRYKSIIGSVIPELMEDVEEKRRGLYEIMKHQTGKDFHFTEKMLQNVYVFCMTVTKLSAKKTK